MARPISPSPGARLAALRASRPLVQAITNFVSMDVAANALLALGASPAMVHAREEVEQFTPRVGALVVNLGTLSGPWVEAMLAAARTARAAGVPWALDPVGVGATDFRNAAALALLDLKPTLIRGNASEILALAQLAGAAQTAGSGPKGVDSVDSTASAGLAAQALARASGAVVAATGDVDLVTDGARLAHIFGGSPLMTRVTALGCALTGVAGAFLAARGDAFRETVCALAFYKLAGSRAGAGASGPGSFRVAFIDALAGLSPDDERDLRIEG